MLTICLLLAVAWGITLLLYLLEREDRKHLEVEIAIRDKQHERERSLLRALVKKYLARHEGEVRDGPKRSASTGK